MCEAVTPILGLLKAREDKFQWKDRDREKDQYRFSRLRRLLPMRMDRMRLQRSLFVDMFSISIV